MNKNFASESNKISPARLSQWAVDKMITDTEIPVQQLLHCRNYSPEQLEALYKIRLIQLTTQSKVRNIAELYGGDDSISALRLAAYDAEAYLSALINQILSFFNKDEVIINLKCDPIGSVIFDLRRTNLIICNLISNSIIHSKKKVREILVKASLRADDLIISISDNSSRITAEKQKQLFCAFENNLVSADFSKASFNLSGLGLPVCRKAARDMGGDVVFLPSPKYNIFELLIPQRKSDAVCETAVFIPNKNETEFYMAAAILSLM